VNARSSGRHGRYWHVSELWFLLGGVVDLSLSLEGVESVDGLAGLYDWLRQEPEFRGRVEGTTRPLSPNELGTLPDVLTVALGSGGAVTALAASLKVFLSQPRRSDVRITIKASDGRSVEIDAKRVNDVEALMRSAFDYPE